MNKLTSNQESFIRMMTRGEEHARRGYELLLKRPDFPLFFDHLKNAGLFAAEKSPGPVASDKPGYFRIPYWEPLDYLEGVAKWASDKRDLSLGTKVMDAVREVSRYRSADGTSIDNYHTWRKFAEILGTVPLEVISDEDIDLLPIWLHSRYERGMVGHSIGDKLLPRLLASGRPEDVTRACRALFYCTEVDWVEEKWLEGKRKKPVTVVEDYWLKQVIDKNAPLFGIRAGLRASEIFCNRLREVFDPEERSRMSWLRRPAVEEHPQNHSWDGSENRFVEGLRDVLVAWVMHDPNGAQEFVEKCLGSDSEIIRRIAIFVINERWENLRGLFVRVVNHSLFQLGHLHELYELFSARFQDLNIDEKRKTYEAILTLPAPDNVKDPERALRYMQRGWLSAIRGKGFPPADELFHELNTNYGLGSLSEHPSFLSYMESWSGPGPSPYQIPELLGFARAGELVQKLNEFAPTKTWRGSTTRALVDALEEAVRLEPKLFVDQLETFLRAKRPFQYGVINALKQLWEREGEKNGGLDWASIWIELLEMFESLLLDDEFWKEAVEEDQDLSPTRNWIPPLISDFLRAGTKDDKHAYSPELLPRTWELIKVLVARSHSEVEANVTDAMTQAINSPKGKAIEAMFSHTLRVCRLGDQSEKNHSAAWTTVCPVFDAELAKCRNANFEFSTLLAAYIANLEYIDQRWLHTHIHEIFPRDFSVNFECAVEGLAYAPATRSIYKLLVETEVVERTLQFELKGRHAHEKMIERVALAYLWGDESLESRRFSCLFDAKRVDDIKDTSRFFWSVSNQQLAPDQIERIMAFWVRCVEWSNTLDPKPSELLSELSRLTCYVSSLTERERGLLLAVAPHVEVGYNASEFTEQLDRLVDVNPEIVSAVLGRMLENYRPVFDYQDKLRSLIEKIAAKGRREEAIIYADRLQNVRGFLQLYRHLAGV